MTVFLTLALAAAIGLLCRQDNVRAPAVRARTGAAQWLRERRKGSHARAVPKPHLGWPKGNHVAFNDTTANLPQEQRA